MGCFLCLVSRCVGAYLLLYLFECPLQSEWLPLGNPCLMSWSPFLATCLMLCPNCKPVLGMGFGLQGNSMFLSLFGNLGFIIWVHIWYVVVFGVCLALDGTGCR